MRSKRASRAIFRSLIYGLGIRHVGERTAGILAREFGSLKGLSQATVEELDAVHEIGLTMAESIHDWFADPGNSRLCARLQEAGVRTELEESSAAAEPSNASPERVLCLPGLCRA